MPPDYAGLISTLALALSIADFVLILWDRRPRLKIGIHTEVHWDEDEDVGPVPIARRLWIDIANHAAKRIWITTITAEWSRYLGLPVGRRKVNLPDLQRLEAEEKLPIARFWIEPWGDAVLNADADEFEYELTDRQRPGRVWYHIAVRDGLGKVYRSNKIMLKISTRKGSGKT